ncbi:MAG: polymerase sigma-B factor [Solirubrobacteraceae bacterium]|jgi:RNA polymerase sigma-B factor|nr:polymerase sigma-B factor [Solirubrobacteraceae bacterium]
MSVNAPIREQSRLPARTDRPYDVSPRAVRATSARDHTDRVLFARCDRGDRDARNALIERFLPLAGSVARRYAPSGEPLEDLVQVASLALVKAVDRFDVNRGYAFSSFAVPTIVGELKRHFRDRTWVVRPPRELQDLTLRIDRAAIRLSQQLDGAPTVTQLAVALEATEEHVLEAMQARDARHGLSLQAPVRGPEDEQLLQDRLGHSDEGYDRADDRAILEGLLAYLPARSRRVLRLRFEHELTQADIGALLGISQMQVSRIVRESITRLRHIAEQQERVHERRLERAA